MFLLDTNAFITLMYGDASGAKFSEKAIFSMMDSDKLFLCVVSIWEIAIKQKLGKIDIRDSISDIFDHCDEMDIRIVPIEKDHISRTLELPVHRDHRDPFDRLILSTASVMGFTIISSDEKMEGYGVEVIR